MHISSIPVVDGPDFTGRSLPLLEMAGQSDGPLLFLTASVHGDEVTGFEVIHQVLEALAKMKWRGRIMAIPAVNLPGLAASCRTVGLGGDDMNRLFPGSAQGGPAQRLAHTAYQTVLEARPQLHLDLHTDSIASIPYVILDRALTPRGRRALPLANRVARRMGLAVIDDWPLDAYKAWRLDRSFSGTVVNEGGIPSMTLELGPTRVILPDFVQAGVTAVWAAMGFLKMLIPAPSNLPVNTTRLERRPGMQSQCFGMVRYTVRPGQTVREGAQVARIVDLEGRLLQEVKAVAAGLVVSLSERTFCPPGAHLLTLAARVPGRRAGARRKP